MNHEIVNHILEVLKISTDKNVILKGLVKLRTDLVKDRDGIVLFHECNGIPPMVRFLHKPHEQILEVVLSILGNCCTNADCCKEALDSKIAIPLATILKSIPNELIQCRACRLLGNLAKVNNSKLLSTHCPAIAAAVCQIIEETNDVQTKIMCFRACHFLLSNEEFSRNFLISNGFTLMLKTLVEIMKNKEIKEVPPPLQKTGGLKKNQHREKYFEEVARNLEGVRSDIFDKEVLKKTTVCTDYVMPKDKPILDLASEILKSLLIISEIKIPLRVWETANRNNSFAVVVFFASEDNPYRSTALKIISNFSKCFGAVQELGTADAVVAACELLVLKNMEKPLSESEVRHCINVICMLSADACNRSKIRRSGAIAELLNIVKSSKSQSEVSSILYALINFQYDQISMNLMLREGLVGILINELYEYLHSNDPYRKKKREEKINKPKKRGVPDDFIESQRKSQKIREESVFDYESPSSSPRSIISPSSPCSSRGMSPVSGCFKMTSEVDSDSETYSPVCSDDEGADDDEIKKTDSDSDIMKLLDIACKTETNLEDNILDKEDEDISQDVPTLKLPKLSNLPSSTIDIIENLLYRVTLLPNKRSDIGKPETLNTLVEAVTTFKLSNGFSQSLSNILSESQFFAQIIKLGVVHKFFQMKKVEDLKCGAVSFLETLSNVGETHYGKGELSRLLRADEASQKRASIAVGFLIKNHRVLYTMLTELNVLNTLIHLILSDDDEFTSEAVDSLTEMSHSTLGIEIPDSDLESFDCDQIFDETVLPSFECDMKFIVHEDDKETSLNYNKKLLSDASEVFHSMLNSDFREGNEGEIHLRNYTASGLRYFLNLIELVSLKKLPNIPPAKQYKSAIEAFELSRVYILPHLENVIFNIMIYLLDETNCQSVLEWSMKNYHAELTEIAIKYYLCSNISTENKVEIFRKADYSMYSNEWNQMITDMVLSRCKDTAYYDPLAM